MCFISTFYRLILHIFWSGAQMDNNKLNSQNDLLAAKIAELAFELHKLEDNFRNNKYIRTKLAIARDSLDDAQYAIRLLDFNKVVSTPHLHKTVKE